MTDLTKLADALEEYAPQHLGWSVKHENIREAAAIIRAAAGVDVAGLMAMILKFGELSKAHGTAIGLYGGDFIEMGRAADLQKSAIESALRLALAARDDDVFTALDMSPDTFRTEGGAVNVGKLRAAIKHPADYLPSDHWLAAAAPKE